MYLTWPIIFIACWYFFNFTVAAVVGLLYLHVMMLLLANLLDKYKEALAKIAEHITKKEGFHNETLKNLFTGEDLV